MSTEDVKGLLGELYPGEVFKRKTKVRDTLGYTHRVFISAKRTLVVTSQEEDGYSEVVDVVEVPAFTTELVSRLRESRRSWVPGGELGGYVFSFGETHETQVYVMIWPLWYFTKYGYAYDGEGHNLYIEFILQLEPLMESCFEYNAEEGTQLRQHLLQKGATDLGDDWYPKAT